MNDQEDLNHDNNNLHTKRKQPPTYRPPQKRIFHDNLPDENNTDFLTLSLSLHPPVPTKPPSPPPPPPLLHFFSNPSLLQLQETLSLSTNASMLPSSLRLSSSHPILDNPLASPPSAPFPPFHPPPSLQPGPSRAPRARRKRSPRLREGKSKTVPAPFPWATNRRATVHTLDEILEKGIVTISGEVHCRTCKKQYEFEFGLREKFAEIGKFIAENKFLMNDKAPNLWLKSVLPKCKYCESENSVKPIVAYKKKEINWLFLLLGQMLGCCTLEQLKYFCKHTQNHRTGTKDRVLFLTYLGLCKQLQPDGPFGLRE